MKLVGGAGNTGERLIVSKQFCIPQSLRECKYIICFPAGVPDPVTRSS